MLLTDFRRVLKILLLDVAIIVFSYFIYASGIFSRGNQKQAYCQDCNVIIIDLDVLRYDAIDCDNAYARTPNICELAEKSVYFKNHSSQSVLTITSFVSAMTSLYPISHNVWNDTFSSDLPGIKYFAEILNENGYKTVLFGHVLNYWQVVAKGYDELQDVRHIYADGFKPLETVKRLESGNKPFLFHIYLDDLHFPYLLFNDRVLTNKYGPLIGVPKTQSEFGRMQADYVADNYKTIFTEEAIGLNKELFSGDLSLKKDRILNLFFDYSSKQAKAFYLKDAWGPTRDTFFKNFDFNDPKSYLYLKENYLEIVHLMDERFGEFLNYIEESRLKDNTIVVIKSNHGEEFSEHGYFQHLNSPYQELVHVPFLIYVPGMKPVAVNDLTQDIDMVPTLLDLLDIEKPDYLQGISLISVMTNKGALIRDYQIAQKGAADYVGSFRKGDRKLIIKRQKPAELYELNRDPYEIRNIILSSPDIAEDLFNEYFKIVNTLPSYGNEESPVQPYIDKEKRERLKEEGYF